ncbi:hypothetical protein TrVE_jg2599 [Triparma verrucosa]|uniref:Uncharacterized protein n=1 Tax=Triparma verrucosa TaxID=1606542 RepID=A0A9W7BTT6_9STRA|nr:hypothetical protein TrVE_jg2599 [Triparma verrucosa]
MTLTPTPSLPRPSTGGYALTRLQKTYKSGTSDEQTWVLDGGAVAGCCVRTGSLLPSSPLLLRPGGGREGGKDLRPAVRSTTEVEANMSKQGRTGLAFESEERVKRRRMAAERGGGWGDVDVEDEGSLRSGLFRLFGQEDGHSVKDVMNWLGCSTKLEKAVKSGLDKVARYGRQGKQRGKWWLKEELGGRGGMAEEPESK